MILIMFHKTSERATITVSTVGSIYIWWAYHGELFDHALQARGAEGVHLNRLLRLDRGVALVLPISAHAHTFTPHSHTHTHSHAWPDRVLQARLSSAKATWATPCTTSLSLLTLTQLRRSRHWLRFTI
eukprot:COSAG05_NODE_3787_length_1836_cov_2.100173_2_plen_128_part_00